MNRIFMILIFGLAAMPGAFAQDQFLPPEGKTLLFIGQDKKTIEDYVRATGDQPSGVMVYASIQKMDGLSDPSDYGSGVNHAQYLADRFPQASLQIGLYMVDALDGVLSGQYDANIQSLGEWIKKFQRPVYLRIGYEFDLPDNHYDPAQYQKAFRYIVDHLRAQNVTNAAYVWHSYGYINPDKPMMGWYPGDGYVDFFAVSFFKAFNSGNMKFILNRAREHHKPMMIAESTPFGIGAAGGERSWALWFNEYFKFIRDNQIPVVCYINADWESQPMWKGKGWGDARVQANDTVLKHWLTEIHSDRFVQEKRSGDGPKK